MFTEKAKNIIHQEFIVIHITILYNVKIYYDHIDEKH